MPYSIADEGHPLDAALPASLKSPEDLQVFQPSQPLRMGRQKVALSDYLPNLNTAAAKSRTNCH